MTKKLTINAIDPSGDAISYNITYLNPVISNATAYAFAIALNNLTDNDFVSAEVTTVETVTGA